MNDITDILRHRHGLGLTRDQIAAAVGVSSGTVSHVLERAAAAGLTWPLPEDIDDDALRARLEPTIADAVLDRIVHNAYRIDLKGESQRKRNKPPPLDGGNDK